MPSSRIDALKSRLGATFERADAFSENPTALADYARYLCVLVSGFIERAVDDILHEYIGERSHPSIHRYAQRNIRSRNVNTERLFQILTQFDPNWTAQLQSNLSPAQIAAINSIHGNRNRIAHGEDSDLTFYQVRNAYEMIQEVVALLEEIVSQAPLR